MKTNLKTQEELFNKIIKQKSKIQNLAGYVQNDFNRMLEDGTATKEDIKNDIKNVEQDFDDFIKTIEELKQETIETLQFYSKQ